MTRLMDRALAALDAEADALRKGRLDALPDMAERRAYAVDAALNDDALNAEGAADRLAAVRSAAARNAGLLEAAISGLRAARQEVERGATVRRTIGYGPDGAVLGTAARPSRDQRG